MPKIIGMACKILWYTSMRLEILRYNALYIQHLFMFYENVLRKTWEMAFFAHSFLCVMNVSVAFSKTVEELMCLFKEDSIPFPINNIMQYFNYQCVEKSTAKFVSC